MEKPDPSVEAQQTQSSPPSHAFIKLRIKELHNRRFLLLKMQHLRKTAETSTDETAGKEEEMTSEDGDELCELEAIEKELEELTARKEQLEKLGQWDVCPALYQTETPYGGIYTLPPLQLNQEDGPLEQEGETRPVTPEGPPVPVDSLGPQPSVTQCPSCREFIMTETNSTAGESVWTVCCLCSMIGCIGGCCLLPFFMDRLKNVKHQCPYCQAHLHTYKPF